jgi:hypothetical protein
MRLTRFELGLLVGGRSRCASTAVSLASSWPSAWAAALALVELGLVEQRLALGLQFLQPFFGGLDGQAHGVQRRFARLAVRGLVG